MRKASKLADHLSPDLIIFIIRSTTYIRVSNSPIFSIGTTISVIIRVSDLIHPHESIDRSSIAMAFAWRNVFTYNRYSGIAARALRRALKEDKRLQAERRNESSLRVSRWKDGVQGEQKRLGTDAEQAH